MPVVIELAAALLVFRNFRQFLDHTHALRVLVLRLVFLRKILEDGMSNIYVIPVVINKKYPDWSSKNRPKADMHPIRRLTGQRPDFPDLRPSTRHRLIDLNQLT
jgi:hypothetical protein